jgi:hypothetical protein
VGKGFNTKVLLRARGVVRKKKCANNKSLAMKERSFVENKKFNYEI